LRVVGTAPLEVESADHIEEEEAGEDSYLEEDEEKEGDWESLETVPSQSRRSAGLDPVLAELGIVAGSAILRNAAEKAAIAAECDVPVLLLVETGTGKELFAKLIHRISERRNRPIVPVNCAAIPKELVESFLFGHVTGSFTGANSNQQGKFETADGTTLFLDELAELTNESQAKLLRVLQDGLVEPLGANAARKVDVRIVAATNRNLEEEVKAGRFREDLYYRLNVIQIRLPSLRERSQEIPSLAAMLLKQINQRRKRERQLSKEALRRLEQHDWPGNVRELLNVLERSALYAPKDVLGPDDLLIDTKPGKDSLAGLPEPRPGFDLTAFLDQARNHLFVRALEKSNGNQSLAAEMLGVTKQAVSRFVQGKPDNFS
jgi:Nif-specific regulatory protein